MAEDNQDFSLAAPEDDDMDFESSLPVEVSSDLKPRVITSTSELRDCVKTGATESTELKMKESIELNMKESTGMKEEMKTGATESIEVKETLATDDDIRKLWRLFDVPVDTDSTFQLFPVVINLTFFLSYGQESQQSSSQHDPCSRSAGTEFR